MVEAETVNVVADSEAVVVGAISAMIILNFLLRSTIYAYHELVSLARVLFNSKSTFV